MPFLPLFLLLGIRRVAARVAVEVWFVPIEISFIEMSVILISMFDAVPPPCADKLTSYQGKRMCWCKKTLRCNEYGVCVCARCLLLASCCSSFKFRLFGGFFGMAGGGGGVGVRPTFASAESMCRLVFGGSGGCSTAIVRSATLDTRRRAATFGRPFISAPRRRSFSSRCIRLMKSITWRGQVPKVSR